MQMCPGTMQDKLQQTVMVSKTPDVARRADIRLEKGKQVFQTRPSVRMMGYVDCLRRYLLSTA